MYTPDLLYTISIPFVNASCYIIYMKTPKTLDEAIINALCVGPLSEVRDRMYHHVKDFMAQKFGVAMLSPEVTSSPEVEKLIQSLFEALTKRGDL